jgi:hypothetical protein
MKNILIIFAIFISALRLTAQTNAPIRLALVSETDEMFVAADVLTAELSGHKNLQLLANASMTYFKSNLFLYVDQASAKQLPNGRSVFERGRCDADLICLDRNYPEPIVVPLKYDLNRGPLPWSGFPADLSPVWMSFTSDFLLIGNNTVPGAWVIPIAEIGAAVATQKQALLAKKH